MFTQVPTTEPYDIPTEFDPNLALGIVWGASVEEVKSSGNPLKSNIAFLRDKTAEILIF